MTHMNHQQSHCTFSSRVPDSITKVTRQLLTDFVTGHYDEFNSAMSQLKPLDFVRVYVSLLKYVVPTLQSIKMEPTQSTNPSLAELLEKQALEEEQAV